MIDVQSAFLKTARERGFVHQCTDPRALDGLLTTGVVTAYAGFDATADSLHVGHLLPIMALRHLQRSGHKPIVLVGGGTTQVGDPSFRDASRPMLDKEGIARNVEGLKKAFSRYLTFGDGPTDAVLVDNADWLDPLRFIAFLRDVGSHFTVNRMMSFDSVRLRLEREQPLTLLEFNYMVLQAYDFVELSRRRNCVLQVGGSDQWGNIVNGVELARRLDRKALFGLTTPLLTSSSGTKMGKTSGGAAVWLNEDRLDAFEFWQFWRNVDDGDVGRFLRMFTDLPLSECERLEGLEGVRVNEAKAVLADEATTMARGHEACARARATARETFDDGKASSGLRSIDVPASDLEAGIQVARLIVTSGLATSTGEARRLIKNGGARLNGEQVTDETAMATSKDLQDGALRLSSGRKRHAVVRAA